jgi:3-oxoacyl-[acyl-carrier-protein] synthase III
MNLKYSGKKITGILTVLPPDEIRFEDEMENYNFTEAQSAKLKKIMGYDRHRIVRENVCCSDLGVAGINYLIDKGHLKKEDIDAIVLVTQTPDYIMPATSVLIQGRLGLKKDIFCIDINQGCAGFLVGLQQAFMILEQESINKVVLINADILSKKVSKKDRNSYPLCGDAASITIIEKDPEASEIFGNIQMDGANWDALLIPAGGMRTPNSEETAILQDDGKGNIRSKDHLVMKGDAVFNFVQTEVPPMINNLLSYAHADINSIDYFMFHQPNKFMLQKLADKMKVSYEKMPNNVVENFGNASGVTIPTAITFNLGKKLCTEEYLICLAGFGVGLTWSSMLLKIGKLDFCEMIDY